MENEHFKEADCGDNKVSIEEATAVLGLLASGGRTLQDRVAVSHEFSESSRQDETRGTRAVAP
jgi:hypothetical protein